MGWDMTYGGWMADDPPAIAARRFARGETTKDEYEAIRTTLSRWCPAPE